LRCLDENIRCTVVGSI